MPDKSFIPDKRRPIYHNPRQLKTSGIHADLLRFRKILRLTMRVSIGSLKFKKWRVGRKQDCMCCQNVGKPPVLRIVDGMGKHFQAAYASINRQPEI